MGTKGRILLHTCCGVCASHCVRVLKEEGWEPLLFFFNPNIHPHAEYLRRREAAQALARAEGLYALAAERLFSLLELGFRLRM